MATITWFGVLKEIENVIKFPNDKIGPNRSHEIIIELSLVFCIFKLVISDPKQDTFGKVEPA